MGSEVPASSTCPFCSTDGAVLANALAYVRADKYPVTPGHMLIVPLRHEPNFLALRPEEIDAIWALLAQARAQLESQCHPDGFNIGVNIGEAGGQTIGHAHLHLIPRYRGDADNPRGGVRGVIPARQHYPP
jgi:diadenosine tetraphosphate (Ap4A) HIT family hydrolase